VSHGICPECAEKQLSDVTAASFAPVAPNHSDASSRSAPGVTTPAAVSTPTGQAVRISFIPLWQVAQIVGLDCKRIEELRPAHWVLSRDWRQMAHGVEIRENSLSDLVGEFAVSDELVAARLLWNWLVERSDQRIAAGSGALASTIGFWGRQANAAPARTPSAESWITRWERAQP
jgi:hypothetical protein